MRESSTPTDANQWPAFLAMAFDMLRSILRNADDPAVLATQLSHQMRELTGAQTVILLKCLHAMGGRSHRPICVDPEKRRNLAESAEVRVLAELADDLEEVSVWDQETDSSKAWKIPACCSKS